MSRLAVLGASGHGKVVADTAVAQGWREVYFFDDAWPNRLENGIWRVMGTCHTLLNQLDEFDGVVVAIGQNSTREHKFALLRSAGARLISLVHPKAWVSPQAELGPGTVVFAQAVINAGAKLGCGVIVNSGAIVEHDCVIADYVHLSPRSALAGAVTVGCRTWIGIGSSVKEMIEIGSDVTVGMGSAVVRNVGANMTVFGVPARDAAGSI